MIRSIFTVATATLGLVCGLLWTGVVLSLVFVGGLLAIAYPLGAVALCGLLAASSIFVALNAITGKECYAETTMGCHVRNRRRSQGAERTSEETGEGEA